MENANTEAKHWHFKKRVDLTHVLTTVALVVSVLVWFGDLDKRVSANTQRLRFLETQQDKDLKRLERRFDRIEKKLDQLLQIQHGLHTKT